MSNKRKKKRKGKLFILSAASGTGKTTLCQAALSQLKNLVQSISYTTRKPRETEKEGSDYHFVDEKTFKKMIKEDQFSEWAMVHGNYYGTPKAFLEDFINKGVDVILNIDVQGGESLRKKYPNTISIFVHPPSFNELKKRLEKRESNGDIDIQERLKTAEEEFVASKKYSFHIVNDDFDKALAELIHIIATQRKAE